MRLIAFLLCLSLFATPVSGLEIAAPEVPASAKDGMSDDTSTFSDGLLEVFRKAVAVLEPELREAARVSVGITAAALLVSLVSTVSESVIRPAVMAGTVAIGVLLMGSTGAMVTLAADTLEELGHYGKLLLAVLGAALAAQGGVTSSGALYAGTAAFLALLQSAINAFFVPGIWLLIALGIGSHVSGEDLLKRLGDSLKSILTWCLKILLMVFTTYLSLTGVVSGVTDAAAMKAAKVGMSTFVPVVGGVLADASEAVLISAGLLKNSAGIYGILATLAIFLRPFFRIACHYLILKLTGLICSVYAPKGITGIVDSFSAAMGLLLGMTAAGCTMVLISTVCFMKGAM